jgi:SRSO17 transposase
MKRRDLERLDSELAVYLDGLSRCLRRSDQRRSFVWYVTGLLLDGERKSIEPIAGRLVDNVAERDAMRQRLQQLVSVAPWDEAVMYEALAIKLERELPGVEALVVDDTGFPKKGQHSVGVARQYSGTLGRTDNCQVGVSLHLAGEHGSGCVGLRLYLPQTWASDPERCLRAGVPDSVGHKKKWQIALEQIQAAVDWGVRKHPVLADAGYGDSTEFRAGLQALGLPYVVGVSGAHTVFPPGVAPRVPLRPTVGRPPSRLVGDKEPQSIASAARSLTYRTVRWRAGSRGVQQSRFACARVHSAERRTKGGLRCQDELWLICEWPKTESNPTKFYFSNLPASTSLKALVRLIKLRWRVERDYQEMKQEVGLDHFEGRTWRGFHHHAVLCAIAHAFLALQRALFPPEEDTLDAA